MSVYDENRHSLTSDISAWIYCMQRDGKSGVGSCQETQHYKICGGIC